MSTLPTPSVEAKKHSQQLVALIHKTLNEQKGWINFAKFMHLALYAPGLGYYSAGSQKFGDSKTGGGDFVTAPQISPLFAQTLSNQIAQVLNITHGNILELGAGTGKLAADILSTLAEKGSAPAKYFILEVSDHLRQVQLETLQKRLPQDLAQRVEWLTKLPSSFNGVIVGNEVLDAIPVHIVRIKDDGIYERGIAIEAEEFVWQDKILNEPSLLEVVGKLNLPESYITEVCPAASGLIASLANALQQGIILMIDYGFGAREYYHPQRNQGTLMCHYQHYAHTNPLMNIGLQDITAHVDFSQIAMLCNTYGIRLAGYASQAQFLMNCGILEIMSQVSPHNMARYAPLAAAAQKLLSPAEMGDLFKVIAFSKNIDEPLIGFVSGDKSHTL
jgi:SAM-dependent MidA family methyltransferase